ncbi:MAG: hypothetical protein OXU74_12645 [Gemmatimonadota bacterium]|nr:hypothetical protein [Gemmatimonadota bacterium]
MLAVEPDFCARRRGGRGGGLARARALVISASLATALALAAGAATTTPTAAAAQEDAPRLLTGLSAEAGPAGVALAWTVDEERAHRIAGFTCVYRTPAHLRTGVSGAVPCGPQRSPADARQATVASLPEYGDYDFELVAVERPVGPAIPWPQRALRTRVTVTEALAGPAGPGRAVTGAGPLVEGCGPGDVPGKAPAPPRPWRLDDIVSAAHLTHYPGRGWTPGGDPQAPPDWPDMPPMTDLMAATDLDPEPFRRVLAGEAAPDEALQRTLADARFDAVLERAGAATKALLRPAPDGGWELRLHTSYPFGADYLYEPGHAVRGWADAATTAAWPELWNRSDCPPLHWPDGTHDVALALADAAGGGRRLAHSGYGWWAVAPVGMYPERIVATKAGLSFGEPAPETPEAGAAWRGRLSGHLFADRRRFAVAGDLTLTLERAAGGTRLAGRIENVVLAPLDPKSLQPEAAPALPWRALTLEAAPAKDGAWSGALAVGVDQQDPEQTPGTLPNADAFRGDWRAAAHGPDGSEIAGRLRLWTPLPDGADPRTAWPGQAVLVAGFGGLRAP